MANLYDITEFLNSTIMIDQISGDPSNNGLQVEGKKEIKKIIFSVDTSESLIYKAIEHGADMIFVHHGLSWGNSLSYISNYNADLLRPLMKKDISLYAVHLPLDGNPDFGHNALIADILKLQNREAFSMYGGAAIGVKGILPSPMAVDKIAKLLVVELDSIIETCSSETIESEVVNSCKVIGKTNIISSIGIVSGGGGMNCVHSAIDDGLDCVITGVLEHEMYHLARENNVSVIAPGHYRTEVPGVVAIMDLLKETFDIETKFIDIPTGL